MIQSNQTEVDPERADALNEIAFERQFRSSLTMSVLAIASIGKNGPGLPFADIEVAMIQRTFFSRLLHGLVGVTEVRRNLAWCAERGWIEETAPGEYRRRAGFSQVLSGLGARTPPAFPALRGADLTLTLNCLDEGAELVFAVRLVEGTVVGYWTPNGVSDSAEQTISVLRASRDWPRVAPLGWMSLSPAEQLQSATNSFAFDDGTHVLNGFLWLGLKGISGADDPVLRYRAQDVSFLNAADAVGLRAEGGAFLDALRELSGGELEVDQSRRFVERPDNFCTVKVVGPERREPALLVTVRGAVSHFSSELRARLGLRPCRKAHDRPQCYSECYLTRLDGDADIRELLRQAKRKPQHEGLPLR